MNNLDEMLKELKSRNIDKDRIIKFTCDCALINIDLIKDYTDKFEDIKSFLQSEASVRSSRGIVGRADFDADTSYYDVFDHAAAGDAYDAADAAYAAYAAAAYAAGAAGAADAAAGAAYDAAGAAYDAADAAANADYAAYNAVFAAIRCYEISPESKAKVEELLRELLK